MGSIKTITMEELKNIPLSEEDLQILERAKAEPSEDCPSLTEEELNEMKPWYIAHPNHNK